MIVIFLNYKIQNEIFSLAFLKTAFIGVMYLELLYVDLSYPKKRNTYLQHNVQGKYHASISKKAIAEDIVKPFLSVSNSLF
ncbi:MAG: hypothetical protein ACI9NA_000287 [Gammaproteobacteria bacterium]|jgi:hypothetical protein